MILLILPCRPYLDSRQDFVAHIDTFVLQLHHLRLEVREWDQITKVSRYTCHPLMNLETMMLTGIIKSITNTPMNAAHPTFRYNMSRVMQIWKFRDQRSDIRDPTWKGLLQYICSCGTSILNLKERSKISGHQICLTSQRRLPSNSRFLLQFSLVVLPRIIWVSGRKITLCTVLLE